MIEIIPHQPRWRAEFVQLATALRHDLGELALRIDHIGSTSVEGLAAKNIIDIQITAAQLDPAIEITLTRAGCPRLALITCDHLPPGATDAAQWTKWFFKSTPPLRPANIHVRLQGRANQRYPILFRDYLRVHRLAAHAYARIKIALALHCGDSLDTYYDNKDPVCDVIINSAEAWASQTHWQLPPSDY